MSRAKQRGAGQIRSRSKARQGRVHFSFLILPVRCLPYLLTRQASPASRRMPRGFGEDSLGASGSGLRGVGKHWAQHGGRLRRRGAAALLAPGATRHSVVAFLFLICFAQPLHCCTALALPNLALLYICIALLHCTSCTALKNNSAPDDVCGAIDTADIRGGFPRLQPCRLYIDRVRLGDGKNTTPLMHCRHYTINCHKQDTTIYF